MTDLNKSSQNISTMFNHISGKYDFLNHFLSMGIDKIWRKIAKKIILSENPKNVLDIATGTGDLAIEISRNTDVKITGLDFSEGMLEIGKKKVETRGLSNRITMIQGDALALPFNDESYDVSCVAFGVRNFENLEKGLNEIKRILKPAGKIVILEFSTPKNTIVKAIYFLYFKHLLPFIGGIFSKDKKAYKYLFDSANAFPSGNNFKTILSEIGFVNVEQKRLTLGIASIYYAKKV